MSAERLEIAGLKRFAIEVQHLAAGNEVIVGGEDVLESYVEGRSEESAEMTALVEQPLEEIRMRFHARLKLHEIIVLPGFTWVATDAQKIEDLCRDDKILRHALGHLRTNIIQENVPPGEKQAGKRQRSEAEADAHPEVATGVKHITHHKAPATQLNPWKHVEL
ncbi:MAG: hypothetical protein JWL62_2867 [Hyphomicrobiales bacterium]|nr:hypothetical protein [Hyphomicrobiales bacterium]